MNTHISGVPISIGTAFRVSPGFRALGVELIGVNQPIMFIEHTPDDASEVWQVLAIPDGSEFPPGSSYVGTFPVLTEQQSYIAVAGSSGMTKQPQTQISIMHAYIRPCPVDAIPPELVEGKA